MKPNLYSSEGIQDQGVRDVYERDMKTIIDARKKKIDFAIIEELEGKKDKT